MHILTDLFHVILATIWDVLPIAAIIFGFQLFVLRKAMPNLKKILLGFLLVLLGLAFFLEGLEAAHRATAMPRETRTESRSNTIWLIQVRPR